MVCLWRQQSKPKCAPVHTFDQKVCKFVSNSLFYTTRFHAPWEKSTMNRCMVKLTTALLFVTWQLIAVLPSYANAIAGEVLFTRGPNSVERDGPTTLLIKGSFIFEGDTINTGKQEGVRDSIFFQESE
jgi:hypothetical protein